MVILGIVLIVVLLMAVGTYLLHEYRPATPLPGVPRNTEQWKKAAEVAKNAPLAILWFAACFLALIVAAGAFSLMTAAFGWLYGGERKPSQRGYDTTAAPAVEPVLALPDIEARLREKERWLEIPVGMTWPESAFQVQTAFKTSRLDREYVANLTFMEKLDYRILDGRDGFVNYHLDDHFKEYVCREKSGMKITGTKLLHLSRQQRCAGLGTRNLPTISIFFELHPPKDALVIRTERVIKGGTSAVWGPVFTKTADGWPLRWELDITILDAATKQLPPPDRFSKGYPVVAFSEPGKDVAYKDKLRQPTVTTFTDRSKEVANERILSFFIPESFGDAFVLVNFRIR